MVFSILKVYSGLEQPTDRDSFTYKRVELTGGLLYELFNEYYVKQKKDINLRIDKDIYFHHTVKDGEEEKTTLDHEKTKIMINASSKPSTSNVSPSDKPSVKLRTPTTAGTLLALAIITA